jgi:phosphoglycerate kinase
LSKLADVYVNDAFAVSHRAHASVSAIKKYLPAYAGLLLENEVKQLSRAKEEKKPLLVIIGGAKLRTKMSLLKKMRGRAERILIGGALANNFLSAHNYPVGRSLLDGESVALAKKMIKEKKDKNIVLPIDAVVTNKKSFWDAHYVGLKEVKEKDYIFDIGPKTVDFYKRFINESATIIWNGPMGMFEEKKFKHGTLSIARFLANASEKGAFCVAGGGETVEALRLAKVDKEINWVSTGGGAMLAFLAGEKMPGLEGIIR